MLDEKEIEKLATLAHTRAAVIEHGAADKVVEGIEREMLELLDASKKRGK
jgi:hypothetical protein